MKPQQAKGNRELAFSVTRKDLKIDTFSAGGPGGQHQNTSNTAVRITHIPSGAAGEARDSRSQHQNMRAALKRMTETGTFRAWVNRELLGNPLPAEEQVKRDMHPSNLLIMAREQCCGCGHADCGQLCCIHNEGTGGEGHSRWKIID